MWKKQKGRNFQIKSISSKTTAYYFIQYFSYCTNVHLLYVYSNISTVLQNLTPLSLKYKQLADFLPNVQRRFLCCSSYLFVRQRFQ